MGILTYNLIVGRSSNNNNRYWYQVQDLVEDYRIQSSVIIFQIQRVLIVDPAKIFHPTKDPLEARVLGGKRYSRIPEIVRAYEDKNRDVKMGR